MNRDELIEKCAEASHNAYEDAAAANGWETQELSRVPWADVPEENKATVRASLAAVLPLIEADLRESIAKEVKAAAEEIEVDDDFNSHQAGIRYGLFEALSIVRGASADTDHAAAEQKEREAAQLMADAERYADDQPNAAAARAKARRLRQEAKDIRRHLVPKFAADTDPAQEDKR